MSRFLQKLFLTFVFFGHLVPLKSAAITPTAKPAGQVPAATKKNTSSKKPAVKVPASFAGVIAPLLPSVVNVSVIKKVSTYSLEIGPDSGATNDMKRFKDFLDQFDFAPKKRRMPVGAGSGFIINREGLIVTNAHVVEGADEVIVTLSDQREVKAKVVGSDPRTDLALLQLVDKGPYPFVKFGDAAKVCVGDWSIAIGNALGLGGTVTLGVISHVGRSFMSQPSHVGGFFQTDASINLGNSGGPLFNAQGEVIGINMMIASPTGGNIGIGFAIPSDVALFVIEQIRKNGYVKRGWLGVHVQDINQAIANGLGLKKPKGALVGNVVKDSPAFKGGVQQGDLILSVDGTEIKNAAQTTKVVGRLKIGKTIPVEVWRKSLASKKYGIKIVYIKIEESEDFSRPPEKHAKKKTNIKGEFVHGLTLRALDQTTRTQFHVSEKAQGIFVGSVHPESQASDFFRTGDVITHADQQPVTTVKDFKNVVAQVKKRGDSALLCLVQRQNLPLFGVLNLDDKVTLEK